MTFAYAWDGVPLPREHGYPLPIYGPGVFGMKQPKWITSVEAVDRREPGYWVRRGWSREARIQTTSVVDTVETDALVERDGRTFVPVGGTAFAGDRGVSRVEVRVDGGPWEDAELREPLSGTTWTLWRYEWPFGAGEHTFAVRRWGGTGMPQPVEATPIRPGGATGLHTVERTV